MAGTHFTPFHFNTCPVPTPSPPSSPLIFSSVTAFAASLTVVIEPSATLKVACSVVSPYALPIIKLNISPVATPIFLLNFKINSLSVLLWIVISLEPLESTILT